MSIEAQVPEADPQVEAGTTPATLSVSQILADLDEGLSREDIAKKYSLEKWMVIEIFKDPALKGKRVKKKRKLTFTFVRDVDADGNPISTETSAGDVNPDQEDSVSERSWQDD